MTAEPTAPYGVVQFVDDAKRITEAPDGVDNREAAVRALEPLLRRALDGPGWEDPRYATVTANGRPGFDYYRNAETSLHIYSVLFRPEFPTPVHDHVTWGLIGVYSGTQRTTATAARMMARPRATVASPRLPTSC